MKQIYLVRHGQYHKKDWKTLSPGYTINDLLLKTDGELTQKGKKQAELTAKRLKDIKFNAIHCSSLQRTKETTKYFSKVLSNDEVNESELLWECGPSMPLNPPEAISNLTNKDIAYSRKKADEAFEKYFHPYKGKQVNELIICHANLIRYFVCKALNIPVETWTKMAILNCGITQFFINHNNIILLALNDSGHLPESMKTYD